MNLGCLSGINFSSCGGAWNPSIAIVDSETMKVNLIENPYAYKFRKKTFKNLLEIKAYLDELPTDNFVLQLKVPHRILNETKEITSTCKKVTAFRIVSYADDKKEMKAETILQSHDTISPDVKLHDYIVNKKPETYDIRIFEQILDKIKS